MLSETLASIKKSAKTSEAIAELKRKGLFEEARALRVRRVRSLSGVSVVAVMTPPMGCVGKCTYCPGGFDSPKSYTGFEPAAMRARQNDYDAFKQVRYRLSQLEAIGHEPQKCELIVMGSTFNSFPAAFQENFVKRAFEGFNGFDSKSLKDALSVNETANYRVTAVTFETRPDWASKKQVEELIRLGATRIELGVQSLDESVLEKVKRGHGTEEVREATRNCRDAFLKICYHMMPGLYSTPKKDAKMFEELFKNKDYRPDALKIYPCLVVQGTKLYDEWLEGRFEPYDEEKAAEALALAKKFVPKYCRIMRVERDIPTNLIAAGVKKSNLREIAWKRAKELGIGCGCIRCRELGFRKKIEGEEPELNRLNYDANEGGELFLSFDYPKSGALAGYLRLRVTENAFLPELKTESTCAGVRELKVVGEQVRIGEKEERGRESAQHKGLGKKLMAEAERIAREEFDCRKLFVISGVGAREYYRKLGYGVEGSFVSKRLA